MRALWRLRLRQTAGRCLRCEASGRIQELLAGTDGTVRPDLQPFVTAIVTADSASAVLQWLRPGQPAARLLEQLRDSDEPITHDLLDQFPSGLALHRLRQTLVHTGVLPERAGYLERLVPWLEHLLADQPTSRVHLLRTYVTWTVPRRARHRARGREFTPGANNWARPACSPRCGCCAGSKSKTWSLAPFARTTSTAGCSPAVPNPPTPRGNSWPGSSNDASSARWPFRRNATDADQRMWLLYGDHRLRLPPAIATLVLAQRDQASIVSAIGRSHPNGVR